MLECLYLHPVEKPFCVAKREKTESPEVCSNHLELCSNHINKGYSKSCVFTKLKSNQHASTRKQTQINKWAN